MKPVNHLAIVAAVVLHQALGFLWYGVLFFNPWLEGLGKTPTGINQSDPIPFILDIAGWFVASYVIAWLIRKTNTASALQGALLGAVLWLGLALPTLVPHYAFAGLQATVTVIDALNVLIALVVTGAVLAAWQKPAA